MTLKRNDFTPMYFQLAEKLKRDIEAGMLKVNDQLPSEDLLAVNWSISRPTVRSALKKLEVEGYLFRVKGKGTFISLPQKRQKRIVVVCDSLSVYNRNLPNILSGIITNAQSANSGVLIYSQEELKRNLPLMRNHESYQFGILFMHQYDLSEELLGQLESSNIPYLIEGENQKIPANCSYVDVDNEDAMWKVVTYLFEQGHRKFAVLSVKNSKSSHHGIRQLAAAKAIRELGGVISETHIAEIAEGEIAWQTSEVCGQILASPSRPTVFICTSDFIAVKAMQYCQSRRIEVPKEISITGFDDIPEYNQIIIPQLTTVKLDYFKIGQVSADTLLQIISDYRNSRQQVKIALELIVRGSSGKV